MNDLFQATARTPVSLAAAIAAGAGRPVELVITRNRVSLASLRWVSGGARLRLHEAFLGAPSPVVDALAAYVRTGRREAWQWVRQFAARIDPGGGPAVRGDVAPAAAPQGTVWDLAALADEVNREHFGGRLQCRVTWGRGRPARRRRGGWRRSRSIRFGSWDERARTVRVHPLLDDVRVPREFVRYIVFHEMLHAEVPVLREGGRRVVHSATFRVLERRYPDLARMRRLARELLDVLVPAA